MGEEVKNEATISLPYPYISHDFKGVYKDVTNKEGKVIDKQKISNLALINEVFHNIDTKQIKAIVSYDGIVGKSTIEIPREDYLNPNNLLSYQKNGLDTMKDTVVDLTKHFSNQERIAPKSYVHNRLGFDTFKGRLIYKHYKAIGIDSTYVGSYAIEPKGTFENQLKLFKEHVLGHAYLEFVVLVSLSAPIIGMLGEELDIDTDIVHLKSNSTTGKTTALKLGISMFGCPSLKKDGLLMTYNATTNAIMKQLAGNKGIPIGFDELSMSTVKNFTDFIYKVANGMDKSRLNQELEQVERDKWLLTMLSSGEKSLVESANKNVGLQLRVFELQDVIYTQDANHAQIINEAILEDYGHFGIKFVEMLMQMEFQELSSQYKESIAIVKENFLQKGINDEYTDRRSKLFGVFYLAGGLIEELIEEPLQLEKLLEVFEKIEKDSIRSRNFDKVAIDFIKGYVNRNLDKFLVKQKLPTSNYKLQSIKSYWGTVEQKEHYTEVAFLQTTFEEMTKEGGFEDKNIVLKELKANNLLDCEKDRLTRSRKTPAGVKAEVYVVKIPL